MLTHLLVRDFALVAHLELEFEQGMSVITGETGAGKSIMLDALGLALGDRAESGLIAPDATRAEIVATFELAGNDAACRWLSERDMAEDECILRRVISTDGRSRGYINGSPATVADMKMLGEMLIDIHSQHEHQSLLKRDTHRRLLDEFGDTGAIAADVAELSEKYRQTRSELDALLASNEEQTARIQLLTYQVEELDALSASAEEPEKLEVEQRLLADAEGILRACNEALALCSEEDGGNAISQLSRAISLVSSIEQPAAASIAELLESSRIQLEEAAHDLARFAGEVEMDPQRLAEVEDRLSALYEVARKHRIKPAEIPELESRIRAELEQLGDVDASIEKLDATLGRVRADYATLAAKLGKARRKAAKMLASRVCNHLGELGMQGARFEVSITPRDSEEPHAHGSEEIEFLISTNPGQAPKSLNRVASGGELSRISLAIQVVTADTSRVPTLVFDEVDVGIGGAVADVVGALLRRLGAKAQIVCVTHLPQVASQGHHHFLVTKTSNKKAATTSIDVLDESGKVEEIARMLGGAQVTSQSRAHAEEMYAAGQLKG